MKKQIKMCKKVLLTLQTISFWKASLFNAQDKLLMLPLFLWYKKVIYFFNEVCLILKHCKLKKMINYC